MEDLIKAVQELLVFLQSGQVAPSYQMLQLCGKVHAALEDIEYQLDVGSVIPYT